MNTEKMTKKERAARIVAALESAYPLAECTLDFGTAWQLMVSVRLAAQCTDARVNVVTPILFDKYPTPQAFAAADVKDIEAIVRPCGLGASKARDISGAMKMLVNEFGAKMPDDIDTLLKFPGVGRKSANLIVGDVFGKPAIVCDTHCIRLTNRFGIADTKDPAKLEKQLRAIIEPEKGNDFCHRLVLHGRAVCDARRPLCDGCCLADICEKNI